MKSIDNRNKESKVGQDALCSGKVGNLLVEKSQWLKGEFAVDINNKSIPASDPQATRWCLAGAIMKCYPETSYQVEHVARRKLGVPILFFNDDPKTTFEDVVGLVKELNL